MARATGRSRSRMGARGRKPRYAWGQVNVEEVSVPSLALLSLDLLSLFAARAPAGTLGITVVRMILNIWAQATSQGDDLIFGVLPVDRSHVLLATDTRDMGKDWYYWRRWFPELGLADAKNTTEVDIRTARRLGKQDGTLQGTFRNDGVTPILVGLHGRVLMRLP